MIPIWAKLLGGIGLVVAAVFAFKLYVASERADERREVVSEVTIAQQHADILQLEKDLAEERKRAGITEKKNADLARDMAADRAGLAAYLERLRRSIADRPEGAPWPEAAAAAGEPGTPGGVPLMDDLRKCTDNTRRLINAKQWYEEQRAVNEEGKPE